MRTDVEEMQISVRFNTANGYVVASQLLKVPLRSSLDGGRRVGYEGLPEHPIGLGADVLEKACPSTCSRRPAEWISSSTSRITPLCFRPPPHHLHRRQMILLARAGSKPCLQEAAEDMTLLPGHE